MQSIQPVEEAFQAAQSGDAARLKALLDAHPNLANTENSQGLTLLGYAAHFGNADAVKVLLACGADVNALSHSNVPYIPSNTALHAALAGERQPEVIRLLLAHGAKTTLFDSNGHTCLHTAAFHDDNTELIRLLLEHRADVNAQTKGGETPLTVAIRQENENVAELLRQHGARP